MYEGSSKSPDAASIIAAPKSSLYACCGSFVWPGSGEVTLPVNGSRSRFRLPSSLMKSSR